MARTKRTMRRRSVLKGEDFTRRGRKLSYNTKIGLGHYQEEIHGASKGRLDERTTCNGRAPRARAARAAMKKIATRQVRRAGNRFDTN